MWIVANGKYLKFQLEEKLQTEKTVQEILSKSSLGLRPQQSGNKTQEFQPDLGSWVRVYRLNLVALC
ncbi:hypothetical protein Y1Q_0000995 [Alligator mississippiensis]|uniref:Uncharacterized protein n=1 Tax=Alligator mississippiensis TaxID=8496 RepID=A0A151NE97_ALLMI|nr:hypothetical protein Y1Q_0000995 [Alligator mississippiensis]